MTRVQKCVETLDVLKLKISAPTSNGNHAPLQQQGYPNGQGNVSSPVQKQQEARHSFGNSLIDSPSQQQSRRSASGADVVITTQWETFDSITPSSPLVGGAPSTSTASTAATHHRVAQPSFTWDLL